MKIFITVWMIGVMLCGILAVESFPVPAYAEGTGFKLVVDCQYGPQIQGTNEKECGFKDVIAQIKHIIDFAFAASLPITIIALTWAGIKILSAQGNMSKVTEAKKLMMQVLTGFVFILAAWLIVYTIVNQLLKPEFFNIFLGDQNSSNVVNTN